MRALRRRVAVTSARWIPTTGLPRTSSSFFLPRRKKSGADTVKGTRVSIEEASGQELLPRSALNDRIRQSLAEGQPLYLSFAYEHQTAIFKRELFTQRTGYGASGSGCDTTFLVRMCSCVNSISFADKALYFYCIRDGSATSGYSAKRSFDELLSLEEQIDVLSDKDTQEASRSYLAFRIRNYMDRFFLAGVRTQVSEEEEAAYCERLGSLVHRIPSHEKLYAELPELRILVEEQRLIPPKSRYDDAGLKAAIVRMTDYLSAVSSTPDEKIVQRYLRISSAYIEEQPTRRARIANLVFVLGQVLRLKDPLRRRVFSSLRKRIDFSALLAK